MPFFPVYVDTGVNAIYARKTTISNRINSGILIHQVLPTTPTNFSLEELQPSVSNLIANISTGAAGSDTVFGQGVRPAPCEG
jgi:hypothetical protein